MGREIIFRNFPVDAALYSQQQRAGEGVNGNISISALCISY